MKKYNIENEWIKDIVDGKLGSGFILSNKDGTFSALEGNENKEFLKGLIILTASEEQIELEELKKELKFLPIDAIKSRKYLSRKINKLEKSINLLLRKSK